MTLLPSLREILRFTKNSMSFKFEELSIAFKEKMYAKKIEMLYHYLSTDNTVGLEKLLRDWSEEKSFERFQFQFGLDRDISLFEKEIKSQPIFYFAKSEKVIKILKDYGCCLYHKDYIEKGMSYLPSLIVRKLRESQNEVLIALLQASVGFKDCETLLEAFINTECEELLQNQEDLIQKILQTPFFQAKNISLDPEKIDMKSVCNSTVFKSSFQQVDWSPETIKYFFLSLVKLNSPLIDELLKHYASEEQTILFLSYAHEQEQNDYLDTVITKLEAQQANYQQSFLEKEIPMLSIPLSQPLRKHKI